MATLEQIRLLTIRGRTEGLDRVQAELAGVSRAHFDVVRASEEATKATDTSARRQASVAAGWSRLTSEMQGSSRAARDYANTVRLIAQAEAQGLTTAQQASQARMFAQSRLQDTVIRSPRVDQSGINNLLGVRAPETGAAKASAAAYTDAAREAEALERSVAALRMQLDPLAAVQARYNTELAEYRALASQGAISSNELAAAEAIVGSRMAMAEKHMASAGTAVKLTSMQVTGLGYQINDVATMLAMGASPFMVISSQAGQVVQVLGDGPGGMAGSLKAASDVVSNFARGAASALGPGGLVIAGVSAATAAALYFTDKTESNLQKIDKAAKSYAETLRVIERSQRGLAQGISSVVDEAQRRSPAELAVANSREIQTQREALRAARENALNINPTGLLTQFPNMYREASSQVAASTISALGRQFYESSRPIVEIRTELEKILAGPGLPGYLRDATEEMLGLVNSGSGALATIKGLEQGAARFRDTLRTAQLSESVGRLDEFLPERTTDRDRINNEAATATELARSYGAVLDIERKRSLAIGEIDRQEADIRAGHRLDLADIAARSAEELRLNAVLRERLALESDTSISPEQRESRAQAAGELAYAQAVHATTEALRERMRANEDAIRSLQIEAETFGLTRGAAQAYRMEQEQLVALYRDAADRNSIVDPAEVERIKEAARVVGLLTDSLDAMSMARDQQAQLRGIVVDARLIGASDDVSRRALAALHEEERLRQRNIDLNSELGRGLVSNVVKMSDYSDRVRRSVDAWGAVKDAQAGVIDSMVDGLSSGVFDFESILQDMQKTMLELAVGNPLKNLLTGSSLGTLSDLFNGPGAAPGLAVPTRETVGLTSSNAMWVRSADGPLGIGALGGGAPDAITKLLNSANSNSPANPVADMMRYRNAIASIESAGSGDYAALGPVTRNGDRAYGRYQMMGNNIGPWSQQALGQSIDINQFMANPAMQDKIFDHIFGGYVGKYGETGASQAWFGGPGSVGKLGRQDMLGTSIGGYGEKFQAALGKLETSAPQLAESATAFTNDFSQITGQVNAGIGQIADQFVPGFGGILTQILNGLRQPGGGGVGGLLGSIFGGGGLGLPSIPSLSAGFGYGSPDGLFANGGYTGPGGKFDPAGIVHRGEYVFDQDAVKRIGVDTLDGMRRGLRGYAAGGYVDGSPARLPANFNPLPMSGGGPRVINNYIDQRASGAPIETKERMDKDGIIVLDHYIRDIARDENSPSGKGGRQNKAFYDLSPKIIQR